MSVTAADLIYPRGKVRASWFQGEDLAANLATWIGDGEAKAPAGATPDQVDAIAKPYAYWQAFEAMADKMAAEPDSFTIEGISETTSVGRVKYFDGKAAQWRKEFEAAVVAATPVLAPVAHVPRSTSVPVRFSW